MREVEVAIIGAGSAGLYCMGQVKRFTDNYVLIDGGELGTTCARVGCMPSKVMIQVAEDFHRRNIFDREGIEGAEHLKINAEEAMEHIQDLRDTFVDQTLSHSIDLLNENQLIESNVHFIDANTLETQDGQTIRARKIIIATGSRPILPEAWNAFSDRIITTDEVFEAEELPESIAVIGLGVIGLEIGQSLNRLGVQVTGIDQQTVICGLQDPEVNKIAIETITREFPLWLGHAADITLLENGKLQVVAGENSVEVDKIFASLGRQPNTDRLNLQSTGLELTEKGTPVFNPHTMQLGDSSIYIAGDCNAEKAILHEAGFEGRVAGYNIMQEKPIAFKLKTPLAITFSDPEIVTVGAQLSTLNENDIAIGEIKMAPVGRALIMGKNRGIIRIYADKKTGLLLGASMACAKGENLGHLLCWSIEMGMTVQQLLRMPFYHPTIEEAVQAALYNLKSKLSIEATHWPGEIEPVSI
ncbi:MAG TPA: dihydrolipoyl dehydrogenase [Gammaproteobacteria bacterium]|nr:dihydrolipoyl dehydrogenase [Gammaproteobacteria bacterium]